MVTNGKLIKNIFVVKSVSKKKKKRFLALIKITINSLTGLKRKQNLHIPFKRSVWQNFVFERNWQWNINYDRKKQQNQPASNNKMDQKTISGHLEKIWQAIWRRKPEKQRVKLKKITTFTDEFYRNLIKS